MMFPKENPSTAPKHSLNNYHKPKMMNNDSFMVFSGTASRYLAEKICEELGCKLGNLTVTKFADGEFEVCYEESIRGRDVFLVQSTFPNSDVRTARASLA